MPCKKCGKYYIDEISYEETEMGKYGFPNSLLNQKLCKCQVQGLDIINKIKRVFIIGVGTYHKIDICPKCKSRTLFVRLTSNTGCPRGRSGEWCDKCGYYSAGYYYS